MLNSKRLAEMARKWGKTAASGRRRLSSSTTMSSDTTSYTGVMHGGTAIAGKGHFVVYTLDQRRFEVPLAYLDTTIFRELLRMSEEEFGLPRDGPITLLCDAAFMDYVLLLLKKQVSKDVERALLVSIVSGRCTGSFLRPELCGRQQQTVLYGF